MKKKVHPRFNKFFGYRDDYELEFYKHFLELFSRYLISFNHYHDNYPKEEYGRRDNYTDDGRFIDRTYQSWTKPAPGKKSYETFAITFFDYTWFAIKFQFGWHNAVFFSCNFSISLIKPSWQIEFTFNNNTA